MEKRKTTVRKPNGSKTVIKAPKRKNEQQLSRDERRSLDKQKREKKRKLKKAVLSLVLLLVVCSIGVTLSLTVFFKINKIETTGDTVYSQSLIAQKCGVSTGDNLFRVSAEKVRKSLVSALPYVEDIELTRKMPGTLIIKIKGAHEVAAFTGEKGYVLLGADGKVLDADANMLKENVPLIDGITVKSCAEGQTVELGDSKKQTVLFDVLDAIEQSDFKLLTDIKIKDINNVKLIYDGRITVKVGDTSDIVNKLKRAAAAIEKEDEMSLTTIGVLDVTRSPNSYFSPGEDEEETVSAVSESAPAQEGDSGETQQAGE